MMKTHRATLPQMATEAAPSKDFYDSRQKPILSFDDVARIYNEQKRRHGERPMTRENARWIVNRALKRLREELANDSI